MSATEVSKSYLTDSQKEVFISVNPKAGAKSGTQIIEKLTGLLESHGYHVRAFTNIDELSTESAKAKTNDTLRAVVAAGGDGTISLVLNKTEPGTPLAIMPLGTENLLSKYLKIRRTPEDVCRIIHEGAFIRMDAGKANGKTFSLMIGCGFDAEAVRRMEEVRTGHITQWSYTKPILSTIRNYQYPDLRIYSSNEEGAFPDEPDIVAKWAFVMNVPKYARGLKIIPDADGTDGLLDLCTLRKGSFLSGMRYFLGIVFGRHTRWKDYKQLRAKRFRIESDERVPYQIDGDFGDYLPLEIEVLPDRLTLLVPKEWNP